MGLCNTSIVSLLSSTIFAIGHMSLCDINLQVRLTFKTVPKCQKIFFHTSLHFQFLALICM